MVAAAITYDQIEQSADRALAYALLVRLTKNFVVCAYLLQGVASALNQLSSVLGPQQVEWLARTDSEEAVRLRNRIEELHAILVKFSRSDSASRLQAMRLPLIPASVNRIQERTEDLGDIVENIALSRNADFNNLVSCCIRGLPFQRPEDVVGSMHN
jgi:hypothetical protein